MKHKFKLNIVMIVAMAVITMGCIGGTDKTMSKVLDYLAETQTQYWQGQENVNLQTLRTVVGIMESYEDLPAASRRDNFDHILKSVLDSESRFVVSLYTVWKPNALDGMDAQYMDRIGSTPTGQYAVEYTRETGKMTVRTSSDVNDSMSYFNSPNARQDRVEQPIPRTVSGKEPFVIRMMVPIINPRTSEVVGGVGCLLDISRIQPILENTIATHKEIAVITMYSSNGFILGHYVPERVGKMLLDVDTQFGKKQQAIFKTVQNGENYRSSYYSSALKTNIEFVMVSFPIGNSGTTWTVMIGTEKAYWKTYASRTDASISKTLEYLTEAQAQYWQGRENTYIKILNTLSDIMANYEAVPTTDRRDMYDRMLEGTITAETSIVALYTIWKPNTLGSMDAQYLGRIGSTPTGQYAMTYTRESGTMASRASSNIPDTMAYLNSYNAKEGKTWVEYPTPRTINGKDTFAIRMMTPIINPRTKEVVGGVGCLIDISAIQPTLENTIQTHEEIAAMVMYSNNGFILAHYVPDRVGKMVLDVDTQFGNQQQAVYEAVQQGMNYMGSYYSSALKTDIEFVMVSFPIGNSDTTWTVMIGKKETP